MNLYPHQIKALEEVNNFNRCAFYLDMGLGQQNLCWKRKNENAKRKYQSSNLPKKYD